MNRLAADTYGTAWQAERGVVSSSGHKRLRSDVAPVEEDLAQTPDVAFFTRMNPRHADGDMLVCLCPLTTVNWASVGARALERAVSRRSTPSRS